MTIHVPISLLDGNIPEAIAEALIKAVLNFEAEVVRSLMVYLMEAATATTSVSPPEGNGWFGSVAQKLFPVEALVVAPLLFAATIGAIFRQDLKRLARVWGVGLPLAAIGGAIMAQLANTGLGVTDGLASLIQHQVAPNLGTDYLNAVTFAIKDPWWGTIGDLISLVVLAGGLAIWLELVLRSAAVELAVFFMPLAFAGLVWPTTAHWARRLLEVLSALLLAKPVIVGALCLGDNALMSARAGPSSLVTGAAILLMAAFAPMALLKLVPVVEVSAIAHLQGMSRQPFHAAERSVQRVVSAVGMAVGAGSAVAAAAGSAGGGGGGGAPPPSDSSLQLLAQVSKGGGDEGGDPLGPARFPPPGTPPRGSSGVPAPAGAGQGDVAGLPAAG